MKNIYLLRHTPVEPGLGICYGNTDVALADSAEEDIAKVVDQYRQFNGIIISSPLTRCKTLASAIANECGQTVKLHDGLKEMHFGDWEMQPWASIPREEIERWSKQLDKVAPANGECFKDVQTRAVAVLESVFSEHEEIEGDLLVVTHGGTIKALLAHYLGIHVNQAVQFNVLHGRTAHIVRGGRRNQSNFYQLTI